ncbi:MAG TPA: hypothetical protein VIC87_09965, partial [Vicinamibacteria bacterium]
VARLKGEGTALNFPAEASDPLIVTEPADGNEAALALFDDLGFRVWLQVEPGNASVETLVHLVLKRYGHHRCVTGVGVDVEWYRSTKRPEGQAVTDAEAAAWLAAAREHDPRYRLFLKHWDAGKMPPTLREGLLFVDDSQILPSLDAMVAEFAEWGRSFAPAPVAFQFGYPSDRPWWSRLDDPPRGIGRRILEAVPNAAALFWVDFTVTEVFPPELLRERGSPPVVGVKIYEHEGDLAALFARFQGMGVNTLFVSEALAGNPEFRDRARRENISVFLIQPVFYDPEALKADPDLQAITSAGQPARDDWVTFVCPSREGFRERKARAIAENVARLKPEGLSIDFIRFFAYWERIRPDRTYASIPNTCFCPHCLERFSRETGVVLPEDRREPARAAEWIEGHQLEAWTDWKGRLVTSMAEEIVRRVHDARPETRVNVHLVPWRKDDFGGARRKVVAQDPTALATIADWLSPMCYSAMLHRDPWWIASVVKDLASVSSVPVLPSIQVKESYPGDLNLGPAEFEAALRAALEPPSAGVVFWSWDLIDKAPENEAVIRSLLSREGKR